ncbi:T9SS type A sorting domain-containing protein [bacterium]|nr:T9SS type A sorting domain-containing protein [bacterium]
MPLINFVQYKGNSLVFGRQNVSEQCVVKCEIYDIRGRRVYSKKVNLSGSNGQFELWNSVDSDSGRPVGSGVYLYRVIANDETFTGKMSIVR